MQTIKKLIAATALLAICGSAIAQENGQIRVDIQPQPLRAALQDFGAQAGLQVIFKAEDVAKDGVTSPHVVGQLSAREALERLLVNTGLKFEFVNPKTVRIVGRKTQVGVVSEGVDLRLVRLQGVQPDAPVQAEQNSSNEIEVVDRRIDGLNNAGPLQTGAEAPLYHNVITREDIERLGVTSMEELFRFIPQTTSAETYAQGAVGSQLQTQERTPTISLRGFSSSQTVVLVNGRALPRTSPTTSGGADISRIPLAAIERIEILPYAGSAIYGAGAIGGVVNVILRKDYSGQDLTVYVGESQDGGASEQRLTYVDGRSFNEGNTRLTLSLNLQRRAALQLGDRDYLDRAIAKYGPDSTVRDVTSGVLVFESQMIPALAQAPATIVMQSPVGDLGIPGRPGVRYATVPVGTSPAQSLTLTPASFVATAGNASTGPSRWDRLILSEPRDNYSLNAQIEHTLIPRRLEAYGEFTVSLNQTRHSAPEAITSNFTLTAADPLNPFGNSRTGWLAAPSSCTSIRRTCRMPVSIAKPSPAAPWWDSRAPSTTSGTGRPTA